MFAKTMKVKPENYDYTGFWVPAAAAATDTVLLMTITTPFLLKIYSIRYFI